MSGADPGPSPPVEGGDGLPSDARPGTYVLVLRMTRPARIRIGALGVRGLEAGWYLYVGSAFGSGGVRGRLRHHLRTARRPRWHVDHLRRAAGLREVWYAHDPVPREHRWALQLGSLPVSDVPVPGFGASDCDCPSHLLHLPGSADPGGCRDALAADGSTPILRSAVGTPPG